MLITKRPLTDIRHSKAPPSYPNQWAPRQQEPTRIRVVPWGSSGRLPRRHPFPCPSSSEPWRQTCSGDAPCAAARRRRPPEPWGTARLASASLSSADERFWFPLRAAAERDREGEGSAAAAGRKKDEGLGRRRALSFLTMEVWRRARSVRTMGLFAWTGPKSSGERAGNSRSELGNESCEARVSFLDTGPARSY
jgi:hypothetical protein